jgi:glycosyltransferase involved in cell wall biosynthesis
VDIVVPLYNSGRWLPACAESLSRTGAKIWFVDDGSPDDSADIALKIVRGNREFALIRQRNAGVCAARNAGAAAGEAPQLMFVDADDLLMPEALFSFVDYLEKSDAVAVFGDVAGIDELGNAADLPDWPPRLELSRWWLRSIPDTVPETPSESFLLGAPALPCATLVRRRTFEQVGGWNVAHGQFHEDADLWSRVALAGSFHYLPVTVAHYRMHANQFSASAQIEREQRQSLLVRWREGTAQQRRTAWIVDHRGKPRRLLKRATASARHNPGLALLQLLGCLSAYRPGIIRSRIDH